MKRLLLVAFFMFFTIMTASATEIIVNKDNSISSISKQDLKNIYFLRKKSWSNGATVKAVHLKRSNSVRIEFLKTHFNITSDNLERYYLKRALSGKGQPPKTFKTEKDIIEFVSSTKGSIGYVSNPDDSVKVISIK